MHSDNKFWIRFTGIIALTLLGLGMTCAAHDYKSDELYVKNGYQRVMVPGSQSPVWQKK